MYQRNNKKKAKDKKYCGKVKSDTRLFSLTHKKLYFNSIFYFNTDTECEKNDVGATAAAQVKMKEEKRIELWHSLILLFLLSHPYIKSIKSNVFEKKRINCENSVTEIFMDYYLNLIKRKRSKN